MKKRWVVTILLVIIVFVFLWLGIKEVNARKDPLNRVDAFVSSETGQLNWFEITSHWGKIKGKYYTKHLKEEAGQVPILDEKNYSLKGAKTEEGYHFEVKNDEETLALEAEYADGNLYVRRQGEKELTSYKGVSEAELRNYQEDIQEELETALDHAEEKENQRLYEFFTALNDAYGYVYTAKDGSFQLFMTVDEAVREGDMTATLKLTRATSEKSNPLDETTYTLNGITDGMMVKLYTTVDGEQVVLDGHFYDVADRFDLIFWETGEKVLFQAVTEAEYTEQKEKFIQRANVE